MADSRPLPVVFFRSETGREPVREWLKSLPENERRVLGEDLKTLQFRWPLGMPLVRSLGDGLWELRSNLPTRIARYFLCAGGADPSPARICKENSKDTTRGQGRGLETKRCTHPI